MFRSQDLEPHVQDVAQQGLGLGESSLTLQKQAIVTLYQGGFRMSVAVCTLLTLQRIEIKRLRLLQFPHILRDDGQIFEEVGYARMIIAEYPSLNIQGSFPGLLRQHPLLLAAVNFSEIVEHKRNVGQRCRVRLQDAKALNV